MAFEIREEQSADVPAIREVNRRAFVRDLEANVVDALRTNNAVLLSLVAVLDGRIVGHILYTPAVVGQIEGAALGPMAVVPEHQRQGIGSHLVTIGNQKLKDAGRPFIVVLGHAGFYPRFGFTPARRHGITCEWDVPEDAFMVLVLNSPKSERLHGMARYRREFLTVS